MLITWRQLTEIFVAKSLCLFVTSDFDPNIVNIVSEKHQNFIIHPFDICYIIAIFDLMITPFHFHILGFISGMCYCLKSYGDICVGNEKAVTTTETIMEYTISSCTMIAS